MSAGYPENTQETVLADFDQYVQGLDEKGDIFRTASDGLSADEKNLLGGFFPNIVPYRLIGGKLNKVDGAIIVLHISKHRLAITRVFDDHDSKGRRHPCTHSLITSTQTYRSFAANPFALERLSCFRKISDRFLALDTLSIKIPKNPWRPGDVEHLSLLDALDAAVDSVGPGKGATAVVKADPKAYAEWLLLLLPSAERASLDLSTVVFDKTDFAGRGRQDASDPILDSAFFLVAAEDAPAGQPRPRQAAKPQNDAYRADLLSPLSKFRHEWTRAIEDLLPLHPTEMAAILEELEVGRANASLDELANSLEMRRKIAKCDRNDFLDLCRDFLARHRTLNPRTESNCRALIAGCRSRIVEALKNDDSTYELTCVFAPLCSLAKQKPDAVAEDAYLACPQKLAVLIDELVKAARQTYSDDPEALRARLQIGVGTRRVVALLQKGPSGCSRQEKEELCQWLDQAPETFYTDPRLADKICEWEQDVLSPFHLLPRDSLTIIWNRLLRARNDGSPFDTPAFLRACQSLFDRTSIQNDYETQWKILYHVIRSGASVQECSAIIRRFGPQLNRETLPDSLVKFFRQHVDRENLPAELVEEVLRNLPPDLSFDQVERLLPRIENLPPHHLCWMLRSIAPKSPKSAKVFENWVVKARGTGVKISRACIAIWVLRETRLIDPIEQQLLMLTRKNVHQKVFDALSQYLPENRPQDFLKLVDVLTELSKFQPPQVSQDPREPLWPKTTGRSPAETPRPRRRRLRLGLALYFGVLLLLAIFNLYSIRGQNDRNPRTKTHAPAEQDPRTEHAYIYDVRVDQSPYAEPGEMGGFKISAAFELEDSFDGETVEVAAYLFHGVGQHHPVKAIDDKFHSTVKGKDAYTSRRIENHPGETMDVELFLPFDAIDVQGKEPQSLEVRLVLWRLRQGKLSTPLVESTPYVFDYQPEPPPADEGTAQ